MTVTKEVRASRRVEERSVGVMQLQQQDPSCVRDCSPQSHGRTNRTFQKRAAPLHFSQRQANRCSTIFSSTVPEGHRHSRPQGTEGVCSPCHLHSHSHDWPQSHATSNPQGKAGAGHAFGDELADRHRGLLRTLAHRVPLLGRIARPDGPSSCTANAATGRATAHDALLLRLPCTQPRCTARSPGRAATHDTTGPGEGGRRA